MSYETREKENDERLTSQVERHIGTLKKLREKLEERQDVKSRSEEYRAWKDDFGAKKSAIMNGKLADPASQNLEPSSPLNSRGGNRFERQKSAGSLQRGGGGSQELSTVLDSLNKLSELEKRITTLEKDNVYEDLMKKERPVVNERVTFEFKKQKPVPGDVLSAGISLKAKKAAWQVNLPGASKPAGGGLAAVVAKKKQEFRNANQNGAFGVFLTGMDPGDGDTDVDMDR